MEWNDRQRRDVDDDIDDDASMMHVVKRIPFNTDQLEAPYRRQLVETMSSRSRRRSSGDSNTRGNVTIETAVFVDASLYGHMKSTQFADNTEAEITHFVLAMINAVITGFFSLFS